MKVIKVFLSNIPVVDFACNLHRNIEWKEAVYWGPVYVAHFYNTCLHPDAQFRFFQPFSGDSVLFNIGKGGTFLARGIP